MHVIGKDILIPAAWHLLARDAKAMGFADRRNAAFLSMVTFWSIRRQDEQILGNIRDPNTFADSFGVEALRYYLMRDCVVGQGHGLHRRRLVQRYNRNSLTASAICSIARSPWPHSIAAADCHERSYGVENGYTRDRATYFVKRYGSDGGAIDKSALVDHLSAACYGRQTQFVEKYAPWKLAKEPEERMPDSMPFFIIWQRSLG